MADAHIGVRVECYAGHRGEQEPRRFYLGGRDVEVADIVDRWLAPDHRYFKLRDADGAIWILRHAAASDEWELTMYERPARGVACRPGGAAARTVDGGRC